MRWHWGSTDAILLHLNIMGYHVVHWCWEFMNDSLSTGISVHHLNIIGNHVGHWHWEALINSCLSDVSLFHFDIMRSRVDHWCWESSGENLSGHRVEWLSRSAARRVNSLGSGPSRHVTCQHRECKRVLRNLITMVGWIWRRVFMVNNAEGLLVIIQRVMRHVSRP